ncbi:hypothetical protein AVEN_76513-1 [Araneus ventricosus]|uniref:Uncharacterized protein n=1 Tax=Araneus ventricosus TaxID=182803 RepID=A0A4Y2CFA3_ARAVE|nr:hypothetical protein AVEN_76513-1 [Araneus ventricosus]
MSTRHTWYILQMFNVCALGHPAHIPTVIQFRPDVQKNVSGNVSHSSNDAFLQCLQRCWPLGYINLVLHITPQEEITWLEIQRHGAMATEEHTPDQRALSSAILYSAATVLPSSEHASHEAGF